MSAIAPTPQQRQAIETAGCEVIVSAAAGSGKTSVLAGRCAYLVSEAPAPWRCDADALLVLTFTEAAAAQMRSRIVDRLRERVRQRPEDARLRRQLSLIDLAEIGTLHAFCLSLVRRYFSTLGVDPDVRVLDADEAALIERDAMDGLFERLYARQAVGVTGASGGGNAGADAGRGVADVLAGRFVELVEVYGLGRDAAIAEAVLRLSRFLDSLPDPEGWLHTHVHAAAANPAGLVDRKLAQLRDELARQLEHLRAQWAAIDGQESRCRLVKDALRAYGVQLNEWAAMAAAPAEGADAASAGACLDRLRGAMAAFEFKKPHGVRRRPGEELPPHVRYAVETFDEVQKGLFSGRLMKAFGRFSTAEWIAGAGAVVPHAAALADLAIEFRAEYLARKRALGAIDFSDLERLAYTLLSADGEGGGQVAEELRARFAHVCVDEFQDINPLQAAIIRAVSRTGDGANLFVVGDVKQSIYRFRLAEPELFLEAWRQGRQTDRGGAIPLQSNFRSRSEVIGFANLLFEQLMRPGAGAVVYDDHARLVAGRADAAAPPPQLVELHLLARRLDAAPGSENADESGEHAVDSPPPDGDDAVRAFDPTDPAEWNPIEREAFLIGRRIGQLMTDGSVTPDGKRLQYRDIAILLRSTKVNAAQVAAMLTSMGIPVHSDAAVPFLSSQEVREMLDALRVLDNPRQDIPLAGVMRTGVLGESFTEDELVEIRAMDRSVAFHQAVHRFGQSGPAGATQRKLSRLLATIDQYRHEAGTRPLADVVWDIYDRGGYLAHVGGLPRGLHRRANLIHLHERARRFGTFRRQGLHYFLRYIELLESRDADLSDSAPSPGAEDAVRIMSIHMAKGLEFPVVFLAGTGTRFNMQDSRGMILFSRRSGIGLRVVDRDKYVHYPGLAHSLVVDEVERDAREEELRVMYVALTRAREKLIVIGTPVCKDIDEWVAAARGTGRPPTLYAVDRAGCMLDWIVPCMASAPVGDVAWPEGASSTTVGAQPARVGRLANVHVHSADDMRAWRVESNGNRQEEAVRHAAAVLAPLPPAEPVAAAHPRVEAVVRRLDARYPSLAVTSVRAVVGASEVKRTADASGDSERAAGLSPRGRTGQTSAAAAQAPATKQTAQSAGQARPDLEAPSARAVASARGEDARRRGILTHLVLQHVDLSAARDRPGVEAEVARLVDAGTLAAEDVEHVDADGIGWFVTTDLADRLRSAGGAYRREFPYIAREDPAFFDPQVRAEDDEDQVLVRGIIDGVLESPDGVAVVDFKTDRVEPGAVVERALQYHGQMALYARALERLLRKPVAAAHLVFLSPRVIHRIDAPGR